MYRHKAERKQALARPSILDPMQDLRIPAPPVFSSDDDEAVKKGNEWQHYWK